MNKKFAIKINKISKSFGQKVVLKDVAFSLYFGEKVGFVGANGSGKSTLAKTITGKIKADSGSVEIFKSFKVSYLPQELNENILVEEYLEKNSQTFQKLKEFGFGEEIFLRKISSLSGGEKTKIFLIKISLEKSPIIILDEPTNNLDGEGLECLEKIIKNSNSAFLIISHDRKFLDNTVSKIIELKENHKVKIYDGNYSDFLKRKKEEMERQNELYIENQKRKRKLEREVERKVKRCERKLDRKTFTKKYMKQTVSAKFNDAQISAGKNRKRAERKLDQFEEKKKVLIKKALKIDFSEIKNSGVDILKVENLKLGFGTKKEVNFEVQKGDRVLISGKNGAGKTTLIKTLLNSYTNILKNVGIKWGVGIEIGYLPQNLDFSDGILIDYFLKESGKNLTDARKNLTRFGFCEEEIKTEIKKLSPGMRSRVKIALMLANNPNLLILDEPTNNIDLEVLEEFEKALEKYNGTIIFVSHDRYFIEKMKPNKKIIF